MDGFDIYMSDPGYWQLHFMLHPEDKSNATPTSSNDIHPGQCLLTYGAILHKLRKIRELDVQRIKMIQKVAQLVNEELMVESSSMEKGESSDAASLVASNIPKLGPSVFNLAALKLEITKYFDASPQSKLTDERWSLKSTSKAKKTKSPSLPSDQNKLLATDVRSSVSCIAPEALLTLVESFPGLEAQLRDNIAKSVVAEASRVNSASIPNKPASTKGRPRSTPHDSAVSAARSISSISVTNPEMPGESIALSCDDTASTAAVDDKGGDKDLLEGAIRELDKEFRQKSTVDMVRTLDMMSYVLFGKGMVNADMMARIDASVTAELVREGCPGDVQRLLGLVLTQQAGGQESSAVSEASVEACLQLAKARSLSTWEYLMNDVRFRSLQSRWGVVGEPGSKRLAFKPFELLAGLSDGVKLDVGDSNLDISPSKGGRNKPTSSSFQGRVASRSRNRNLSSNIVPTKVSPLASDEASASSDIEGEAVTDYCRFDADSSPGGNKFGRLSCQRDLDNLRKLRDKHRALLLRSVAACKMLCPYEIVVNGNS